VEYSFSRGIHVAHFYSSFSEQKEVGLPFLREGLDLSEHCLFTVCDHSPDDWYFELQAYGVDVANERQRGALLVLDEAQTRSSGEFNSIRLARDLWRMIQDLLTRFNGVRLAREVPWQGDGALTVDHLCQMETAGSLLFEDADVRALCQYDLDQHPPAVIHTALRTHPVVIVGGRMQPNPFYEVESIVANEPFYYGSNASDEDVAKMLGALR
jgi:hypothetical protein